MELHELTVWGDETVGRWGGKDGCGDMPEMHVVECRVGIRDLAFPITLRCVRWAGERLYELEQSHFIHAPGQAAPYRPSDTCCFDPVEGFKTAAFFLEFYYNDAVRAGHRPCLSWFVPNKDFGPEWFFWEQEWRIGGRRGRRF